MLSFGKICRFSISVYGEFAYGTSKQKNMEVYGDGENYEIAYFIGISTNIRHLTKFSQLLSGVFKGFL